MFVRFPLKFLQVWLQIFEAPNFTPVEDRDMRPPSFFPENLILNDFCLEVFFI